MAWVGKVPCLKSLFQGDLPGERRAHAAVWGNLEEPDLAATLRRIAENGRDGYYKGVTAQAIVDTEKEFGGVTTLEDLADFQPEWVEPISTTYRGWTVYEIRRTRRASRFRTSREVQFVLVHGALRKAGHFFGYGILSLLMLRAWWATLAFPRGLPHLPSWREMMRWWSGRAAVIAFLSSALSICAGRMASGSSSGTRKPSTT